MADNVDREFREGQIRMEGKLDRIGDAVQRQTEDMRDLRVTVTGHGTRITTLETRNTRADGRSQGLITGGRLAWALIGTIIGGGGLIGVMRLLGIA